MTTVERGVGRPAPKRAVLNNRQRRMQKAIAYIQEYMADYHKQPRCIDYSDETLIDDVLYGLGVALHGTTCSYADGYEAWKVKLREHLKPPNVQIDVRSASAPSKGFETCPQRGPFVRNSLRNKIVELHQLSRQLRKAYKNDHMNLPCQYLADAYYEAAVFLQKRLDKVTPND